MPNRILRDWTDSYAISGLDATEERFFVRLIMKADDFGRFHADPRLLKSYLFPLLPDTRETDCSRWLAACEKAGLLRCYVDDRSRKYLEITNFRQRTRQSESKFPSPVSHREDESQTPDKPMTVKRPSTDRQLRTETKTETKTETYSENRRGDSDEPHPIWTALEEIYPGHATNFRTMREMFDLAIKLKATVEQVRAFPVWLAEKHPKKGNSPFAFRDLFFDSLKTGATSAPVIVEAKYNCAKCKDRFVYTHNGQPVKCDCWQKEQAA
jgi:hypothetical protein